MKKAPHGLGSTVRGRIELDQRRTVVFNGDSATGVEAVSLPFGGVLETASNDQMQLPSIKGNYIVLSTVLLTNLTFFFLGNFVRMTDEAGQPFFNAHYRLSHSFLVKKFTTGHYREKSMCSQTRSP